MTNSLRPARMPRLLQVSLYGIVISLAGTEVFAGRVLFDATNAEWAGNADWVIDSDSELSSDSNPLRYPTPGQSGINASTPETYWKGALSAWGITQVKHGNTAESLPRVGGAITYGNSSNAQDLSHYKSFVVCEPNGLFTATEKTAMVKFVANGGGLFIVSDHNGSDRDNDGVDSVDVWNDFFTNNGVGNNPFGISINSNSISQTSSNVNAAGAFRTGTQGTATSLEFNSGATMTISPSANASVKAAVWTNGTATTSTTNVMMAYASYGLGRVVALGDSSPADDGTGDTGDSLFTGWTTGTNGVLISNANDWLNSSLQSTYDASGGGSFGNAASWTGLVPDAVGFTADFSNNLTADSTVTLDRARTVGQLRFDSARRYTLAGTATLTLAGATLATTGIIVTSGSHTIDVPLYAGKGPTLDIKQAASVLTVNLLTGAASEPWTKIGLGRVDFQQVDISQSVLTISVGSMRLVGATTASPASRVQSLSISAGGALDLGAGSLTIDYLTTSPLSTIKGYLVDGRLLTNAAGLKVGYAEASAIGATSFGTYNVDGTALLLRATKPGDTNLDAGVDFADLLSLAQHFSSAGNWSDGDFNYDGTIDFSDLLALAQNFGSAGVINSSLLSPDFAADWALAQSLVPEPMTAAMLLPLLCTRRRRR